MNLALILLTLVFSVHAKTWHTEPSSLLLQELKTVAMRNDTGTATAIRVYSLRDKRYDVEWNDTVGISYHKSFIAYEGDTLEAGVWVKGVRNFTTATKLSDSLFSHITRWYNKEKPSEPIAAKLLSKPGAPQDYIERLRYFSKALKETPYSLGPTGEGRYANIESLPLIDLSEFDCVTYIESVIGLALSHQPSEVLPNVLPIRYHGDTLTYATRNHFFVGDWLGRNAQWFHILRLPGDTVVHKTLFKQKLLSAKGIIMAGPDPIADYSYLPYDQAMDLATHWNLGKRLLGIAFVTHREGLDVTHTGFIDAESGKPVLRHASELKAKVTEQDFKDYLESRRGKCAGILLFEFLPPPSGR